MVVGCVVVGCVGGCVGACVHACVHACVRVVCDECIIIFLLPCLVCCYGTMIICNAVINYDIYMQKHTMQHLQVASITNVMFISIVFYLYISYKTHYFCLLCLCSSVCVWSFL